MAYHAGIYDLRHHVEKQGWILLRLIYLAHDVPPPTTPGLCILLGALTAFALITCQAVLMKASIHCWFNCARITTSDSMATLTNQQQMVRGAAVLMMVLVVFSGFLLPADAEEPSGRRGWGKALATFYGGKDGQGTMGE